MEKGEVEGYCGWSLDSISSRAPDWLPSRKIKPLAQFTLAKSGLLPNIPVAHDLAGSATARQAIEVLESNSILAWPLIAPPDLPRERVKELRAAFDAANKDAELLAEAKKIKLQIDPVRGDELQQVVEQLLRDAQGGARPGAQDSRGQVRRRGGERTALEKFNRVAARVRIAARGRPND